MVHLKEENMPFNPYKKVDEDKIKELATKMRKLIRRGDYVQVSRYSAVILHYSQAKKSKKGKKP